jgi:RNA polymerase sigma-70 factor (ECF subfamily)
MAQERRVNARNRDEVEAELRRSHAEGDFDAVATLAVRYYGPEVLGFLVAMRRDSQSASEIFSQFCEDLWTGVPHFAWASSFRTWAYVLARHALVRYGKDAFRRRSVPFSQHLGLEQLEQQVRTQTMPYLRTDMKQRAARLRERLEPDEQALLVLRVDRGLSWNDIARVLSGHEPGLTPADFSKAAVSLRKRFERVKDKLKALMAQETPDDV